MEKEKKKRKVLIITIIMIAVVVVGIVVFTIINNAQVRDLNGIGSGETEEDIKNSKNDTLSDEELEVYVEKCFRYYEKDDYIDKIEKYQEDGQGKYIYITYYHWVNRSDNTIVNSVKICFLDFTESNKEPKVYSVGTSDATQNDINRIIQEKIELARKGELKWENWSKFADVSIENGYSSSSSENVGTYLDDTILKALAFNKWISEDSSIYLLYNTNNCVYTGEVAKNSSGSVSVSLALYKKEDYEYFTRYNYSLNGYALGTTIITLTKEEATNGKSEYQVNTSSSNSTKKNSSNSSSNASTPQNSSSNSANQKSNSNNNSNMTNVNSTTNKEEEEDVVATLNINLKSLIAKNKLAQEIKEKYPTIFIHVNVEDAAQDKYTFEYHSGGKSIPDTITTKATLSEGSLYSIKFKNRNEKRKVTITMDNTSTMIVETTLFEGEMVFNKTGTYEIK